MKELGFLFMFMIVLLMLRSCTDSKSQDASFGRCAGSNEEIRGRNTYANLGMGLWCGLTAR